MKSSRIYSGVWQRRDDLSTQYPNGNTNMEVFVNYITGERFVRRYNEVGDLIFTNEKTFE